MSYAAENITRIESEITELVTDLYEAFSSEPGIENKESNALDRYIKRVARIGLCAGKGGLVSLQDVCVVYKQILGNLREQNNELSTHVRERLELWPMLAMALLTSPIDDELYTNIVEFFEDPIWPQSFSNDDVAYLRSEIRPVVNLGTKNISPPLEQYDSVKEEMSASKVSASISRAVSANSAGIR